MRWKRRNWYSTVVIRHYVREERVDLPYLLMIDNSDKAVVAIIELGARL